MDIDIRLKTAALFLNFALIGCSSGPENVTAFVGEYSYVDGQGLASCSGESATWELVDIKATVTATGERSILFDAGRRCQVNLEVQGNSARAASGQGCELTIFETTAQSRLSSFRLELSGSDSLRNTASGTLELTIKGNPVECEHVELSGVLQRESVAQPSPNE